MPRHWNQDSVAFYAIYWIKGFSEFFPNMFVSYPDSKASDRRQTQRDELTTSKENNPGNPELSEPGFTGLKDSQDTIIRDEAFISYM